LSEESRGSVSSGRDVGRMVVTVTAFGVGRKRCRSATRSGPAPQSKPMKAASLMR
jgi:hypothetical protein